LTFSFFPYKVETSFPIKEVRVLAVILFILVIGFSVFIHELGHFLAARVFGIETVEFTFGYGRTLWERQLKCGTYFRVRAIPLGGRTRVVADSLERTAWHQRLIFYAAGMLMNVLAAGTILAVVHVGQAAGRGLWISVLAATLGFQQAFSLWLADLGQLFVALHNALALGTFAYGPISLIVKLLPSLGGSVKITLMAAALLNALFASFDLLPLPICDCGRILMLPFEKLLGRKVRGYLIFGSLLAVLALVVCVTLRSILRIFGL
jgi:membrane-associated protease RseP (regulator of RpoE activity)